MLKILNNIQNPKPTDNRQHHVKRPKVKQQYQKLKNSWKLKTEHNFHKNRGDLRYHIRSFIKYCSVCGTRRSCCLCKKFEPGVKFDNPTMTIAATQPRRTKHFNEAQKWKKHIVIKKTNMSLKKEQYEWIAGFGWNLR